MAEALAVVGAKASIVQLMDFSARVIRHLEQFQSDAGEVLMSLPDISTELSVLSITLHQIWQALKAELDNNDVRKALVPVLIGCGEQLRKIEFFLAKTLPASNDSWGTERREGILSLYQNEEFKSITMILRNYIANLNLYYAVLSTALQPLSGERHIVSPYNSR